MRWQSVWGRRCGRSPWLLGLGLGLSLRPALAVEPEPTEPPAESARPDRHLVLGPVVGAFSHAFDSNQIEDRIGPVFGAFGRVDPLSWLGVRALFLYGTQPVVFRSGALRQPSLQLYQPPLSVIRLGLRAEPTLNLGHRTDLVAGLGLGWERCIANELTSHDATHLRSYNRAVVFVDYEALVGLRTEPVRDWLSVGLSLSVALPTMQTGTLLDSTQAFTADGHRIILDGLPSVSHRFMGLFELGLIL